MGTALKPHTLIAGCLNKLALNMFQAFFDKRDDERMARLVLQAL
ncbi:MAG: hypothetical protein ACREF9_06430 [Opitutaceae bacterium]